MDSDGSNTVNLTVTSGVSEGSYRWSPDGDSIAYIADSGGIYSTWLMKSDGSHKINICSAGSGFAPSLRWSPDGAKIAFGESDGYYIVNKDGTGKTKIHNIAFYALFCPPEWKDNSVLYVPALYGANLLYAGTINSDGTNLQKFSQTYLMAGGGSVVMVSPDRNKIAYMKGFNLYVTDFSAFSTSLPGEKGAIKPINNLFDPTKGEKTTIQYKIPTSGRVVIKLYTSDGVYIKTLVDADASAGTTYSADWSGVNLNNEVVASGIYLVNIQAPGYSETKKICIVK